MSVICELTLHSVLLLFLLNAFGGTILKTVSFSFSEMEHALSTNPPNMHLYVKVHLPVGNLCMHRQHDLDKSFYEDIYSCIYRFWIR
jgi:hypothetical protein